MLSILSLANKFTLLREVPELVQMNTGRRGRYLFGHDFSIQNLAIELDAPVRKYNNNTSSTEVCLEQGQAKTSYLT